MDFNALNKQSYDKIAKAFSAARGQVWRDLELFRDYVKDGDKVLDLGCGNGRLLELFKNKKIDYWGLDSSKQLINEARAKFPDKRFVVGDALHLAWLENSFAVVICVAVLNHFPHNQHQDFINNVKKVLRPGGYLLMANWNLWNVLNKKSVWRMILRFTPSAAGRVRGSTMKEIITQWRGEKVAAPLFYYAFSKREVAKLLSSNGFAVVKNFYSRQGKQSSWLFGKNIITVARRRLSG